MTRYGSDLTRSELEHEYLAISAVTALGGGESQTADAIAARIESRFRKARPWLKIVSLSTIRTNFDVNEYHATLQRISEGVDWAPQDLEFFGQLTNHARYLLLVDLHSQTEHKGSYQSPNLFSLAFAALWTAIFDDDCDDSAPEIQMDRTKYHKLALETQMGIFDLQLRKMVWLVSVRTRVGEAKSSPRDDPKSETLEVPAPAGFDAVDQAIKAIANRLPR